MSEIEIFKEKLKNIGISENDEKYDLILKSFSDSIKKPILKLVSRHEDDISWLFNQTQLIYYYKTDNRNRASIPTLNTKVLTYYVKYGLGKNSSQTRARVRSLEGIGEKELNSINKTLRDKGFITKGLKKESDHELCKELENLRTLYNYLKQTNNNKAEISITFIK